jgi:hypothetical protein
MNTGCESATRRNFILAGSAQILFALESDVAFGQSPPVDLGPNERESLDRLIDRFTFLRPSDFTEIFWNLWGAKVDLTLTIVKTDVREVLNEFLLAVQNELLKEYGGDNPIPRDRLHLVLAGTIYVQNVIFAVSTNAESGIITITNDTVQRAKGYYCAFYPYCK